MFLLHSLKLNTLFIPLICLSLVLIIDAQTPQAIRDIHTAKVIDLYEMYNGVGWVAPGASAVFSWNIYDEKGPIFRTYSANGSIEIMAGPAEEARNEVVDIAAINVNDRMANYFYPASIPLGLYHARINATVNMTTDNGGFNIQQLTARSETVNVTTSSPIGCGPKKPAPFTNVPSTSAPTFTSLYIREPSAGFNVARNNDTELTDQDTMKIQWAYRDQRNALNKGISDVTVQIMDSTTSAPVGPLLKDVSQGSQGLLTVKFTEVPMKLGGSYKIELKYRNAEQDGTVKPGDVVTFTSQDFNVVLFEDKYNNCANITSTSSSSNSTSNGSSAKQNGGTRSFAGLQHIIWVGLLGIVSYFL